MHTRSKRKKELLPYADDIEKKFRKLRLTSEEIYTEGKLAEEIETKISVNMIAEEQKSLREYAMPTVTDIQSSIRRSTIDANNFEIKSGTIQML